MTRCQIDIEISNNPHCVLFSKEICMKKLSSLSKAVIVSCVAVSMLGSDLALASPENPTIIMIVKQSDPWFDDMTLGISQLKEDSGANVYVQTPVSGDPSQQIAIMENLISQKVDAICVVPNDPKSLIPTIKKARDAGIKVVTHEAPDIAEYVDLDVEAFKSEDFGKLYGQFLGEAIGGEGQYAGFVGGLTMTTHMAWYEAAVGEIKAKFPKMEVISDEPYEDKNSLDQAYAKTVEILKAYPKIKGFFDCSVHGSAISQALKDKKRTDVKVVSLALPSTSANYLKDGSMYKGLAWRPADAGYTTAYAALKLVKGEKVETDSNLKAKGYEKITVENNIAFGFAPLVFTAENIGDYQF